MLGLFLWLAASRMAPMAEAIGAEIYYSRNLVQPN